jgi:integrase
MTMLGRQAKILSAKVQKRALAHVSRHPDAVRDRVIVLLSIRAGLRAGEIARLTWGMALDHDGRISATLDVRSSIAKKGSGRRIPLHPELRQALTRLYRRTRPADRSSTCPVICSAKGGAMRANSIVNWFVMLYAALHLAGCSSHSGRRTFITNAARRAHKAGASLRDVQMLAGHRSIETTQAYIDGDTAAQRKLVSLI